MAAGPGVLRTMTGVWGGCVAGRRTPSPVVDTAGQARGRRASERPGNTRHCAGPVPGTAPAFDRWRTSHERFLTRGFPMFQVLAHSTAPPREKPGLKTLDDSAV